MFFARLDLRGFHILTGVDHDMPEGSVEWIKEQKSIATLTQ